MTNDPHRFWVVYGYYEEKDSRTRGGLPWQVAMRVTKDDAIALARACHGQFQAHVAWLKEWEEAHKATWALDTEEFHLAKKAAYAQQVIIDRTGCALGWADNLRAFPSRYFVLSISEDPADNGQRIDAKNADVVIEEDRETAYHAIMTTAAVQSYGTPNCLCRHSRHSSCYRRRSWCMMSDCLCDACRGGGAAQAANQEGNGQR